MRGLSLLWTALALLAGPRRGSPVPAAAEVAELDIHQGGGRFTWITLINSTPYRWDRTYTHSYQLEGFDDWPQYIWPGQTFQLLCRRPVNWSPQDSAGEVQYYLSGTAQPMGFQVEYRSGMPHSVWVRFRGELSTLNNARATEHELGDLEDPGGVGFMLAGREGLFVSNDGPLNWMQAMLPAIGHLPLRELAMPRSHNTGMWKAVAPLGVGLPGNTLTQVDDLYSQLGNGGIRVLDLGIIKYNGEFRVQHASDVSLLGHQGMVGAGVEEMIDVVNRFSRDVPGELIVFDIRPVASSSHGLAWSQLLDGEVAELYDLFHKLDARADVPDDEDLTRWPLERFVAGARSAVLVRFSDSWLVRHRGARFPGGAQGFVTTHNLPYGQRWSDTDDVEYLVRDQLTSLRRARPARNASAWDTQWILTQHGLAVAFPVVWLTDLAKAAWRTLYWEFWAGLTDRTYPNWITIDSSHRSQLKAMAMAINLCLGARQCGKLGGKVLDPVDYYHDDYNATVTFGPPAG
ncbi:hypothetical protein CDD83_2891 [Cordyceps sp. RAO-2017]|nr:hypothetical protein CDD83_2891 [Cordyceps sp. RAO-2017]